MIELVVQIIMSMILLVGGTLIGVTMIRMHRDQQLPSMFDLITATDRNNIVRLDAKKCFEAGSFLTSTWVIIYITAAGRFSFEAFGLYMAAWTTSRWLRDREKRLQGAP